MPKRAGCRQVLTAQKLIELHNHSLTKLDSVKDTRSHIAVHNGLQEVDCGLIVGGKRRTLAPCLQTVSKRRRRPIETSTTKHEQRLRLALGHDSEVSRTPRMAT
eukprot:3502605-Pleurochrysis_carterae.AAC.1